MTAASEMVVADDPAEGLAQVAAEEQASLLVLGASQRSSLGTPLVVVPRSPEFGRSRRIQQPAAPVAGAQPAPA